MQSLVTALGETKIVNLDTSIKNLMGPIASSIKNLNPLDEVALHIVCCNEYFLVTGLQADNLVDVGQVAPNVRAAVGQ